MDLKAVIRAAHGVQRSEELEDSDPNKVHPLFVVPRHEKWLKRPEEERVRTPEALDFALKSLSGYFKHNRVHRFSPSSIASDCEREILFSFGGAPKLPFPMPNQEKADAGVTDHLRWQMEGIDAGYLQPGPNHEYAGELWVYSEHLKLGGSADGRLEDGSLFELKNTGGHLFDALKRGPEFLQQARQTARVTGKGSAADYAAGMYRKHLMQMEAYWECDRIAAANGEIAERTFTDFGSLVYQDTFTKEIHEFRVHSNPKRLQELHHVLEPLHEYVDLNELPDMLEGCRIASGNAGGPPFPVMTDKQFRVFNSCGYHKHCPTAATVFS